MGFLNNHNDVFTKSKSAWGDDNMTVYNLPNRNNASSGLQTENMGYDELEEMITQVSSIEPSNLEDEDILNSKLETLSVEKQKRDELENVTRIERNDAFEPRNTIVKQDVVQKPKPIARPKPTTSFNMETSLNDLDVELESLMSDDLSVTEASNNSQNGADTNTFLLAALIVIVIVKLID
jgi:hypothetical protein